MKYDLFIGISLYNTYDYLQAQIINLKNCVKNSELNVCITYFDDGSCEESKLKINEICRKEKVPVLPFAHRGFGFITKQAADIGVLCAKYVLILDSDVFLPSFFIRDAVQLISLSSEKTGVLSYKSIKINMIEMYRIVNGESSLYDIDSFNGKFTLPEKTTQLASYCFLFSSDSYQKAGGFCPEYKGYFADSDFCCRLAKEGYTSYRVHQPKVFHIEHGTMKDEKNKFDLKKIRTADMETFKKYWGDNPEITGEKLIKNL